MALLGQMHLGPETKEALFREDFVRCVTQCYCDNSFPISVRSLLSSGPLKVGGFEYKETAFRQGHLCALIGTVNSVKVDSLTSVFRVKDTDVWGLRGEEGHSGCS